MSLTYLPPKPGPKAYRAGWVMVAPDRIEPDACLETMGGGDQGHRRFKRGVAREVEDLGPGIILPLLVNAHTHLELSALKGKADPSKGFETWVKALMAARRSLGPAALADAARREMQGLTDLGTGAVAEISTLGLTRGIMAEMKIPGIWFQEVLGGGFDPGLADFPEKNLSGTSGKAEKTPFSLSLAGHAPHTTAPDVLEQAKAATRSKGLPFSIHVAESDAESRFLRGENPGWEDFLSSRGIDFSGWPLGDTTPVAYLDALSLLGPDTLGVHLIDTTPEDLDLLAQTGTRVCLCPRSNQALHGRLPDIQAMLDRGIAPALGTDSLASCSSLSLFDEMAFVRKHYPGISPESVMAMATVNGASALGLSAGTLEPGGWAGCLYIDLEAASRDDLLERLTTNEC